VIPTTTLQNLKFKVPLVREEIEKDKIVLGGKLNQMI
jgi:hypothetical protein